MHIRGETESDIGKIYSINSLAFETINEAELVNALREKVAGVISLVACDEEDVVGHIMFSPMTMEGESEKLFYGLAPVAVSPKHQNKGIGSLLVKSGLDECKAKNVSAVFVLGHPSYYPRFGFIPASSYNIRSEYDAPDEVFMALELKPNSLKPANGVVRYHNVFNGL